MFGIQVWDSNWDSVLGFTFGIQVWDSDFIFRFVIQVRD
jgi:hypothetical protein